MENFEFYRQLSPLERALMTEVEKISIMDCHEHLIAEEDYLKHYVDAFTLFSHYCRPDFLVAGMSDDMLNEIIPDFFNENWHPTTSLEERFAMFEPYYNQVKYNSYARAARIAMKKFYGIDDLNSRTVGLLTERIRKNHTKGLYHRVLKDACGIDRCINQGCASNEDVMSSVARYPDVACSWSKVLEWDMSVRSFEDYLNVVKTQIEKAKKDQYIGVKFFTVPLSTDAPDYKKAKEAFDQIQADKEFTLPYPNPLVDYVYDFIAKTAVKASMVFCLHAGYWGDFRENNVTFLYPLVANNPDTKFDIYHLGYPYVREAMMLGKVFGNVWLNMCWTYVISQKFAEESLYELFDLVPVNKILGFGGDYLIPEKVFGHMIMAKESIVKVLAKRIEERLMSFDDAVDIAHKLLRDNPKALYAL